METQADTFELDVLLPVHNEAASITGTIEEIYQIISPIANMQFIISEDGSSDGTQDILRSLAERYPIKLISGPERKGYSRAVVDGLRIAESPYILCLDSDGQCDPRDFARFWPSRQTADVLIGWRVNRQDTALRKALSQTFKLYYKTLFHVPIHDPSCPFILIPRSIVHELVDHLGILSQGFWWEFVGRVWARGHSLKEIPIQHRLRTAGQTQVYRLRKMPGIGWSHTTGLVKIWMQDRQVPIRQSTVSKT